MTATVRPIIFLMVLLCQASWQHARAQQVTLISDGIVILNAEQKPVDSSSVRHVIYLDTDNAMLKITGKNADWRFAVLDTEKVNNEKYEEDSWKTVFIFNVIDQDGDAYFVYFYIKEVEGQSMISLVAVSDKNLESFILFRHLKRL